MPLSGLNMWVKVTHLLLLIPQAFMECLLCAGLGAGRCKRGGHKTCVAVCKASQLLDRMFTFSVFLLFMLQPGRRRPAKNLVLTHTQAKKTTWIPKTC